MTTILGFAPMDGFTDMACRNITQQIRDQYGEKDLYDFILWTEFMTADGFIRNPDGVKHHLDTSPNQTKLIVQIFGGNPETLIQAIKTLQKDYHDRFIGIELNMGCPANNVMKSGGGAELIKNKTETLEIIKNIKQICTMPFSIKTRAGVNEADKDDQLNFLIQASNYVDMITIHGRTIAQGYGPSPDREFIYKLKNNLPSQTIIGNGGITSYEEIPSYLKNLNGIMIGQAAIGNPRIFTPHIPSLEEKYETICKHLAILIDSPAKSKDEGEKTNERKILEFRKHLYSYVKGLTGSKEFKIECNQYKEYQPLLDHITRFFDGLQ